MPGTIAEIARWQGDGRHGGGAIGNWTEMGGSAGCNARKALLCCNCGSRVRGGRPGAGIEFVFRSVGGAVPLWTDSIGGPNSIFGVSGLAGVGSAMADSTSLRSGDKRRISSHHSLFLCSSSLHRLDRVGDTGDGDGVEVYFRTRSVHLWKTTSEM